MNGLLLLVTASSSLLKQCRSFSSPAEGYTHGCRTLAQNIGNLLVRHLLEEPQHDNRLIARLEAQNRLIQHGPVPRFDVRFVRLRINSGRQRRYERPIPVVPCVAWPDAHRR